MAISLVCCSYGIDTCSYVVRAHYVPRSISNWATVGSDNKEDSKPGSLPNPTTVPECSSFHMRYSLNS